MADQPGVFSPWDEVQIMRKRKQCKWNHDLLSDINWILNRKFRWMFENEKLTNDLHYIFALLDEINFSMDEA